MFLALILIAAATVFSVWLFWWIFFSKSLNDGEDVVEVVQSPVGLWSSPTVATTIVRPTTYVNTYDDGFSTAVGIAAGVALAEELEGEREVVSYPVYPTPVEVEVPAVPVWNTPTYSAPVELDVPAVPSYNTSPANIDVPYTPSQDTSSSYDRYDSGSSSYDSGSSSYDSGSSSGGGDY